MNDKSKARRTRVVDVARRVGVSTQTVSNVINRRGGFTEQTEAKVLKAIAELGFQPNRYAQSLRSRRTGLIGFDMIRQQLDASNPFTLDLLKYLITAAQQHDARLLVFTHDEGRSDDFRTTATSGLVDGFILSDSTTGDARVDVLTELEIPFVVMGDPGSRAPVTALDIDNSAAMRAPVDHVVAQGCRSISYVGYSGQAHWNTGRRQGVRQALAAHGLSLPRHHILTAPSLEGVRKRLPGFLSKGLVPDAVICSSDSLAVAVVAAASSLGLRVGVDLAVTGFDDGPLATMVSPEITSVAVPLAPVAATLMELITLEINGQGPITVPTVESHLVIRASSGFSPMGER